MSTATTAEEKMYVISLAKGRGRKLRTKKEEVSKLMVEAAKQEFIKDGWRVTGTKRQRKTNGHYRGQNGHQRRSSKSISSRN